MNTRQAAPGERRPVDAEWSSIITAEGSSCCAARKDGPMSLEKTPAWKANGKELSISIASSRISKHVTRPKISHCDDPCLDIFY
jgi:hypothetical protein